MKKIIKKPKLHDGNIVVDDRGIVTFNNELDLTSIVRYYIIENHNSGFIRAWHGHKKEEKYVKCIKGTFQISIVKIDNFKNPSKAIKVDTWYLSEKKAQILYIPEGYANGTKSLDKNSQLLVLSTASIKESLNDDFRFPFDYWNPWISKYR